MIPELEKFEGTFCDLTEPCYYTIEKEGVEYIKIPFLEVIDRKIHCHFELLKSDYSSQEEIEHLVYLILLGGFCKHCFKDDADFLVLKNLQTNEEWQIIYIG